MQSTDKKKISRCDLIDFWFAAQRRRRLQQQIRQHRHRPRQRKFFTFHRFREINQCRVFNSTGRPKQQRHLKPQQQRKFHVVSLSFDFNVSPLRRSTTTPTPTTSTVPPWVSSLSILPPGHESSTFLSFSRTTSSSTAAPTTPSPAPEPHPPRPSHWSTTSFIGGMVFAFGMVAIGFVAFKFYKARNERNYHTL